LGLRHDVLGFEGLVLGDVDAVVGNLVDHFGGELCPHEVVEEALESHHKSDEDGSNQDYELFFFEVLDVLAPGFTFVSEAVDEVFAHFEFVLDVVYFFLGFVQLTLHFGHFIGCDFFVFR